MKETRLLMGMGITAEISDSSATKEIFDEVFSYFKYVDEKFSTYKNTSEISRVNSGELSEEFWSKDMKEVFALAEETKKLTDGYFDIIRADGTYDPSGLVKGWAIFNAAEIIKRAGFENFYVEAGGDIEARGKNGDGEDWKVGIRDPFDKEKKIIVKVISVSDIGIATSGTYVLGQHIYNPHARDRRITEIVSFTVVGPNIYEADRFATAAFAMGREGIRFIENLPGFEGYMIDKDGIATETSGFKGYVLNNNL